MAPQKAAEIIAIVGIGTPPTRLPKTASHVPTPAWGSAEGQGEGLGLGLGLRVGVVNPTVLRAHGAHEHRAYGTINDHVAPALRPERRPARPAALARRHASRTRQQLVLNRLVGLEDRPSVLRAPKEASTAVEGLERGGPPAARSGTTAARRAERGGGASCASFLARAGLPRRRAAAARAPPRRPA